MFVVIAAIVGLSCGGHAIAKRSFPSFDFVVHNEVAGFIIAVVGVLYSVLLGFLTVIVWEQYTQADERAGQEVNAVADAYALARNFPQADALRLRDEVAGYGRDVLFDEWPKMKRGERSDVAEAALLRLIDDAARLRPRDFREANLQAQLLDEVRTMADLHRRRVDTDRSGIPSIVWAGLIVGAMAVMGFVYLFGYPNVTAQMLMTAFTAVVIGVCFSIVIKLDFPFRGDISITSQRWSDLNEQFARNR